MAVGIPLAAVHTQLYIAGTAAVSWLRLLRWPLLIHSYLYICWHGCAIIAVDVQIVALDTQLLLITRLCRVFFFFFSGWGYRVSAFEVVSAFEGKKG